MIDHEDCASLPSLNSAVLFLVFNRPDTTSRVFQAIRKVRPSRLYVAADGPRAECEGEVQRVSTVRGIATAIDWPCELKTLFRENNRGCKRAVSEAITWFFEQEEQGIILEDDCLPHQDFFFFCDILLCRYKDDPRVAVITGNNFQNGIRRGEGSYYFSKFNHCWGWASWRHAWCYYQGDLPFWPEWSGSADWRTKTPNALERRYWSDIFQRVIEREVDSWDYPWMASVWYQGGLTATPNVNLVSNIGFGPNSTHTASAESPLSALAIGALGELKHPMAVEQDVQADSYTFDHAFGGESLRFPASILRFPRRLARSLYRRLKRSFT